MSDGGRRGRLWCNGSSVTLALTALAIAGSGCGDSHEAADQTTVQTRLETTRLCALVPARDAAAAAFPPTPPVRVFGTDLGWTYELNGTITLLFGDSWQRIDRCPIRLNDDSLATMQVPAPDWPGYMATESLPESECPELTFVVDSQRTQFASIELRLPDGTVIPLGPLNTPLTGFYDGQREWGVFIVGGGQPCSADEAANASPCPAADLSPQAADLVCGLVGADPLCIDPTSTKGDPGRQAYYLHFGERVGPTQYISRAMFLTNKYLNLTARTVRAFDDHTRDYRPGTGALLMWGRPGFDDQNHDGEAPPYFMYHSLPLELDGDRLAFQPRYFQGLSDGAPTFGPSQADAVPLYTGEFEPVNQAAVSYIEPLSRWLMIYGGGVVDFADPNGTAGQSQLISGAMYSRFAPDPWGPWTEAAPILVEEDVAQDMVCGKRAPSGCLPPPTPLIRPACIEAVDPHGGAALYGANIIDALTRGGRTQTARGHSADVFWNLSTWHPYSVVLVKTHIELK